MRKFVLGHLPEQCADAMNSTELTMIGILVSLMRGFLKSIKENAHNTARVGRKKLENDESE
jgi:hypothetical protein